MLKDEIRAAISSRGSEGYVDLVESLLERDSNDKRLMEPESFSIKTIYDAFVEEKGGHTLPGDRYVRIAEATDRTAFAKITGELINSSLIDAYNFYPTIGDQLTRTVPSNLKKETVAGIHAIAFPELVGEGKDYPEFGTEEKFVEITNRKYGEVLEITEETIMFDQTNQILVRAGNIGEGAALYRDKLIVQVVMENTDAKSYYPSGTGTTLYDNTAYSNLSSSTAFNTAGLNTVVNKLREMTDERSNPIIVPEPWVLLLPSELMPDGEMMFISDKDPYTAEEAPNIYKGRFRVLTSPFLTSATDWWIGNFPREFWWTEVYPLQTLSRPAGTDADFYRDIRYAFKVRFYGGCSAVDTKYVIEANA